MMWKNVIQGYFEMVSSFASVDHNTFNSNTNINHNGNIRFLLSVVWPSVSNHTQFITV